ncbi:hypothetical protein ACRYCC_34615 [Actinomadura scrupuli]|uniref:hypothetical protein n=1 Tax=Actinomadura scrupuli TaxID=559629 RepID=UPI003D960DF8
MVLPRSPAPRLGRGLALAELAEQLRATGVRLQFLTGELQGSHDPSGVVFTVPAAGMLPGSSTEVAGVWATPGLAWPGLAWPGSS